MAEQKEKHQLDEFVAKIVKDPKNPPDVILLSGFLGTSSESGYTRLYFDAQLSSYVEIPNDDILYSQAKSKEESTLGGSYVWINKDAELIHGKVSTERTKGKFFEGPIVQEYFKGGGPVPGGIEAGPITTKWEIACRTTRYKYICETPVLTPYCFSEGVPCQFETIRCDELNFGLNYQTPQNMAMSTARCVTQVGPCWTELGPNCQTQFFCPEPTQLKCPTPVCPTLPPGCGTSFGPNCQTQFFCPPEPTQFKCLTPFCPTLPPGCGTSFGPNCQTALCPRTQICPITQVCPRTQLCPNTQICPRTQLCPDTGFCPQVTMVCPSAVDACPSALGCFDPGMNFGGWR